MELTKLSELDRQDLANFQRWLSSLNRSELLKAMQFTFQPTSGESGSHEFDLLSEMVEKECPPATPLFPGALGFRQCSKRWPEKDFPCEDTRRRIRPRLFQWNEGDSYYPRPSRGGKRTCQKFDVIARQSVTKWGEVLGVACTEEQRLADQQLVEGTSIRYGKDAQTFRAVFRGSVRSDDIIRILQVASRGQFLRSVGQSSIPFCAPWLQPTERWFSLSMYMANRYHVSLWGSFTAKKVFEERHSPNIGPEILNLAIPPAVCLGFKTAISEGKEGSEFLRDSLIWKLIMDGPISTILHSDTEDFDAIAGWKALTHTPLRQLHTPTSRLHAIISKELDATIAIELQKQILKDNLHEAPSNQKLNSYKSKKKKKQRRKPRERKVTISEPVDNVEVKVLQGSAGRLPLKRIQFPTNKTLSLDRNRNIIMALTILEEVVEAAFVKVGLEATPPFEPVVKDEKTTKHTEKQNPGKLQNRIEKQNGRKSAKSATSKPELSKRLSTIENTKKAGVPSKIVSKGRDGQSGVGPLPQGGMFSSSPFSPSHDPEIAWPSLAEATHPSAFEPFVAPAESAMPNHFYPSRRDEESQLEEPIDGWPFINRYQAREQSILSEFFRAQQERNEECEGDDEKLMVASTGASISSSTYEDSTMLAEADDAEKAVDSTDDEGPIVTINEQESDKAIDDDSNPAVVSSSASQLPASISVKQGEELTAAADVGKPLTLSENAPVDIKASTPVGSAASSSTVPRSPSPQAPLTPPPTLSPMLVSLADLRHLKHRLSLTPERLGANKVETKPQSYFAAAASGSLPSSPTPAKENGLSTSWSRDDLRIGSFRDDQNIKPKRRVPQPQRSSSEIQPSYRAAVVKSLAKPIASSKATSLDFRSQVLASGKRETRRDYCTRSETALDAQREDQNWQGDFRTGEDFDNKSLMKDETTTITSALSNREPEEISALREERNAYRDMCLTLGAEVSTLKAMLAAQQATAIANPTDYHESFGHPMYRPSSFDPQGMQPFFYGHKRGQRRGPMSDAGLHRGGDHESQLSEDDMYEPVTKARVEIVRQISSNATIVGSDTSVEFNNSNSALHTGPFSIMPVYDSIPIHGLQSRLTKDILRFLDSTRLQLKKQDNKRRTAVERFGRLVTAIWPRAQVKLYGSHVSGLCLPSSDLDFVVCLPAVQKRAPALAPGVLEGRNAINESSQKLLARELKGESWIDPRSIKLIERTVVPVIKLSTKDVRAKVVQLDVSFDSPEHHGLEANAMVAQILEELPLIRPLMLVLKQFLLDRGLLTAYTGGLSSYCLFLMVARYLQEQPLSVGDCGSLLMGFLDFYGNHFDPRAIGISVRRRQYFPRPNHYQPGTYPAAVAVGMWVPPSIPHTPQHMPPVVASPASAAGPRDFLRRNSFSSDTVSVDGGRRGHRPPRFQSPVSTTHRYIPHKAAAPGNRGAAPKVVTTTANGGHHYNSFGHGRPFTFDPLFVEDPLASGNNVGRNAFRIFQIQRAFSDAHRALVAGLEWDIHSSGELNDGVEYPLLKCLLQSEDVLYEL